MALRNKVYEPDLQTDRAKNVKGEVVFIDFADSGRQGYFCLGCEKPMQANIQKKNPNHRSYFSHIPVDLSIGEKKCIYSNREQRELIATDIVQRLKRIKVPGVLKFPPNGVKGNPIELSKERFISAHKVRSQLTFYEDEEGVIYNGKNPEVEDRYLLLRPDVTFFNEKDEAILFIELVDTHKISDEKKIKLRRLGIDTISIIVPRASDQEIEENFKSVQRVKWEYNDEEARTSYLSVSYRAPKGVLEFDQQQRRNFGESVSCRRSRINNTIRSLRKCLDGKLYGNAEQNFEREIFRVKSATEGTRERLGELETRIDKEVRKQFTEQNINLERQGGELNDAENKFQEELEDLERRYQSKKDEIRGKQEGLDKITRTEFQNGGTEESIRERFKQGGGELRNEFEEISKDYKRIIEERNRSNKEISEKTEKLSGNFRQLEREEQESFTIRKDSIEERAREYFRLEEESLSKNSRREERNIGELRDKESTLSKEFGELEEREQENFGKEEFRILTEEKYFEETIREEYIRELKQSSSGLPKRTKFILEAQRVGSDYKDAQRQEDYYKRAQEFFNKGTWQKK